MHHDEARPDLAAQSVYDRPCAVGRVVVHDHQLAVERIGAKDLENGPHELGDSCPLVVGRHDDGKERGGRCHASSGGSGPVVRFCSILATASNRAEVSPLASRFVEAVVVGAALLTACWWFTRTELNATFWGFPLDDSWIHLQFASNIASGQGFSYNPGIPVAGSTAPLWTLVLAIPARFGLDPVAGAKGLGIALTLAAALVAGRLAEWLTSSRAAGFFTALVLVVSPRLVWGALSGMEVSLYALLGVWAVLSYLRALET